MVCMMVERVKVCHSQNRINTDPNLDAITTLSILGYPLVPCRTKLQLVEQ